MYHHHQISSICGRTRHSKMRFSYVKLESKFRDSRQIHGFWRFFLCWCRKWKFSRWIACKLFIAPCSNDLISWSQDFFSRHLPMNFMLFLIIKLDKFLWRIFSMQTLIHKMIFRARFFYPRAYVEMLNQTEPENFTKAKRKLCERRFSWNDTKKFLFTFA